MRSVARLPRRGAGLRGARAARQDRGDSAITFSMRPWPRPLSALCLALLVVVRSDIGALRPHAQPRSHRSENASVDELLPTADKLLARSRATPRFRSTNARSSVRRDVARAAGSAGALRHGSCALLPRDSHAAAREHALTAAEIYERVGSPIDIGRIYNFLSAVEELSGSRGGGSRPTPSAPSLRTSQAHDPARARARRRCS